MVELMAVLIVAVCVSALVAYLSERYAAALARWADWFWRL